MEIDGDIETGDDKGGRLGPTIYTLRRSVAIAGHDLLPGETFTLDICTGGPADGRRFHRDLLVRNFHPTFRLRYCDQMDSMRGGGSLSLGLRRGLKRTS